MCLNLLRCFVPGCDDSESPFRSDFVDFAIPQAEGQSQGQGHGHGQGQEYSKETFLSGGSNYSECHMYERTEEVCVRACVHERLFVVEAWYLPPHFQASTSSCDPASFSPWNVTSCSHGLVFDRSTYESTLVTQLGLVCGAARRRRHEKFLGTVLMAGLMVGCFVGGPLGDRLGRRATLVGAAALLAPLVAGGAAAGGSYEAYAALRLFSYVCVSVMWISSHALVLELFGRRWRKLAFAATSVWYCLLNLLPLLVVYLERDWRYMHLWVGAIVASTVLPLAIGLRSAMD